MPTLEASVTASATADVERIAGMSDPVLRNLLITQCYCEQSAVLAKRMGSTANWCTFATWASKQAGQTIRSEDLQRTLKTVFANNAEIEEAIGLLNVFADKLGFKAAIDQIRRSVFGNLLTRAATKAADAVARGNKKVFEEIAFQFARFEELCVADTVHTPDHLRQFCSGLKSGLPPDGQDYLQKAFTSYYQAFFEEDEKKKTERCFLANLEIGFHEQTRLQPEITEALNAGGFSTEEVKNIIVDNLLAKSSLWGKIRFFFQRLFGKTGLLEEAIQNLAEQLQVQLRRVVTDHLMTLTLPPANRLRLAKDLTAVYPAALKTLEGEELLSLLTEIDPVPDSLLQSGATDWANFQERMHFIAELFRCYHTDEHLFSQAFTEAQIKAMKEGKLPDGEL